MKRIFTIIGFTSFIQFSCTQKTVQYKFVKNVNYNSQKLTEIKNVHIDLFDTANYSNNTTAINYRILNPLYATKKSNKSYPLIIVLHGSGEIGTDNKAQMGILAKMWATPLFRLKYSAFILVPQFPRRSSNYVKDSVYNLPTSQAQPALQSLFGLIDSLKYNPKIDTKRIYLVGFSMGASTAMNALAQRKDLFAAAIAFSGIPDFSNNVVNKPLWIIHGNADDVNTFSSDSLFYKRMIGNNAKQIKFWEINKLKHEVPLSFITNEEIPKWLFKQKNNFIP